MEKVDFSKEAITSEEELRNFVGTPHELVKKKSISIVDDQAKRFISMSPLLFLATSDAEGNCDVSPRGDNPGSIVVLNDHQLVIPDRPGNRRVDSILNILTNPHVGLLFVVPGLEEVLRINGRATIIKNKDILSKMSLKGKAPSIGIGVDVEACFIHCTRALHKSKIWNPEKWPNKEEVPSMMEIFHAHLKINGVKIKE
ncbi:MSMEG_1061 family FMN-dependent PPOX-type flavoprotein [Bacillus taeanensis]|uniref:Pyridoxamine 5'-phosphate oxidase family protein n=1 Tax=Bacillus taeanensis TaxID=273032 RepID=A0A366XR77_9BACI|nr:MSMEG_1061 family FMN-dependent PPOX-type flavoprotein [Bacillus taeanensis]RBW68840.1 pyridoxamine 5'-phosphate oxidase family protein [Bacillus taeanensis]